jgi:hypothetical protein
MPCLQHYTAAYFKAPVVPVEERSIPQDLQNSLENGEEKLILVAATERLLSDQFLEELDALAEINRVADENLYKHSLLWARSRWGNFGWGMDENFHFDAYYNFVLANPETPEFAAAGLPMAYEGNYGPLIYTESEDLNDYVDQYSGGFSPDLFLLPSDGPFMNVRIVGDSESISYNAQARADLALEVRSFKNQVAGASGISYLAGPGFFIGFLRSHMGSFYHAETPALQLFLFAYLLAHGNLVFGPVGYWHSYGISREFCDVHGSYGKIHAPSLGESFVGYNYERRNRNGSYDCFHVPFPVFWLASFTDF